MLAAVSLLVLTLILTVVLTWLVATELGSASPENEDEVAPTAVTAQPEPSELLKGVAERDDEVE